MTDRVSKETRSRIMSSVRGKDTAIELAAKPVLEALGFEHQPKDVAGNPDFAHRQVKVAVFLDGCFWHGCPEHYRPPKSNAAFWAQKIANNIERDRRNEDRLKADGWRVIRVWEHDLKALVKAKNESNQEKR